MGRSDYQTQQDHEDYDKWVEPKLRQCKTSCNTHPTLPVEQPPPSNTPPHQNIVRKNNITKMVDHLFSDNRQMILLVMMAYKMLV